MQDGQYVGRPATLRHLIAGDFYANDASWLNPGFHAAAVYRFGNWLAAKHGLARTLLGPLHRLAGTFITALYHIELPPSASIGRRLRVKLGVAVHPNARIGDDCVLRHRVTIGAATRENMAAAPVLGDRVEVGVGAVVMGRITVGDDVRIGPNAVVMSNIPAGSSVTVAPPRVLQIMAKRIIPG
jgi:serine O-acetyltransferase